MSYCVFLGDGFEDVEAVAVIDVLRRARVTVDIYGHLIPGSNRDAVNRLDRHPSAPYAHLADTKKAQPVEIAL